ncbi:hypothetical protein [Amycolatopsis sp. NPDC052450]|uniref:hypothetical protein n=1 Tax=Amycolatopsis sp. NPDC052450 TaxID=3363937 RepID=UPI0037CA0333
MTSLRRVHPAEQERLLALGDRTEAVLRAAGFPVIVEPDPDDHRDAGGAVIEVDVFEGACGVWVDWVVARPWRDEAFRFLVAGDKENPRVRQQIAVHAAMRTALTAVLTAAGLTVVPSDDDMRPLELKVTG